MYDLTYSVVKERDFHQKKEHSECLTIVREASDVVNPIREAGFEVIYG